MKIAFTGKGGVGKTTLAALAICSLARRGQKVLAVDCDPDSNLAALLGFDDAGHITPIARMKGLIRKRMEVKEGVGPFYKLNPKIDDIPDAFKRKRGTVSALVMGTVERGDGGCMCPESTFLRNLLGRIMLKDDEHVVLDMEAGIEHLGRGTAAACDYLLTVVEPSTRSVETALKIAKLARGIGIRDIYAIANKVRSEDDRSFITRALDRTIMIASVPLSGEIASLDRGGSVVNVKIAEVEELVTGLLTRTHKKPAR